MAPKVIEVYIGLRSKQPGTGLGRFGGLGERIRVVKRRRQSETEKMEGSSKFTAMGRKRLSVAKSK